jgi:1-deoxy-D-xylulose-5-phosphate reductoisomerase
MRRISLLGSTGSIGTQCLDLAQRLPETLQIVGLGAGRSLEKLSQQAKRFRPLLVCCSHESDRSELVARIGDPSIEVMSGDEGQRALASLTEADTVLAAVVGYAGLTGTLAAARAGKRIALANKESLVAAGELLSKTCRQFGAELLPVDSEHAALHQCLAGESMDYVKSLWLTASGGPFRGRTRAELESIGVEEALNHPNWSMGPKISVDSATLMNKGLELIEAAWLFDVAPKNIEIVVHPPSLVHSMVEFIDGSFKAQLGAPDMRGAIAYALSAPKRLPLLETGGVRSWNPVGQNLAFEDYDRQLFVAPDLCRSALEMGGGAAAALNAINEVVVARFIAGKGSFLGISQTLQRGLDAVAQMKLSADSLEAVENADSAGRNWALSL